MKTDISKQTLDLGKAFIKINNAEMLLTSISNDLKGHKMTDNITEWAKRLRYVLKEFKRVICTYKSEQEWQMIEDQLLNDEDTLQIESINEMMLHLPKGIKDDIERYVEQRFELYKLN